MGEISTHVHRLADDQWGKLAEALAALAPPLPAAPPSGANVNPYDIGLEPWAFHDPHTKAEVVAYVDDRNQVRHVPVARSSEVPLAWRRVWLEDRNR